MSCPLKNYSEVATNDLSFNRLALSCVLHDTGTFASILTQDRQMQNP